MKTSKGQGMFGCNNIRQWVAALAVTSSVAICGAALFTPVLRSQDQTPTFEYGTNGVGMQFVMVPAGSFPMGCSDGSKPTECTADEKPQHMVQITKAFEMGKTEVTQKQWQAVMGANPSQYKGDDLPVEEVSFDDVQAFLDKLNSRNDGYTYRLPTEAEWEYAARAGTKDAYAGAVVATTGRRGSDDYAWYSVDMTEPVATKKPNSWGIYDMRGNVAEWVQDWYDPHYYFKSPQADPKGPAMGDARVVRGGSFHVYPWLTRVSLRTDFPEGYSFYDLGFRAARDKR